MQGFEDTINRLGLLFGTTCVKLDFSRHSQSNPIELNFNRTQSYLIELNSLPDSIELTEKKKNQSNPIERSIFELVICALKIHNQILEARVTSTRSVAHTFFLNEEIPQKWLQMRCGL